MRILLAAVMLVCVTGCAGWKQLNTLPAPAPRVVSRPAAWVAPPETTAVCEYGACKEYWERAQVWVAHHSLWTIQTATDVLIQTGSPGAGDLGYAFTVTRDPLGEGRYRIVVDPYCAGTAGSDCTPSPRDVARAFYHYVLTGEDVLAGAPSVGNGVR